MKKILTKAIMAVMALALIISGNVFAEEADTTPPIITIGKANPTTVTAGGSVTYKVVTSDNSGILAFNITRADITMKGFTADIAIAKGDVGNQKIITFSNIQSTSTSEKKYFVLGAGVAADGAYNLSLEMNSPAFTIKEEEKDTTAPIMTIGAANPKTVIVGEKVVYKIAVSDNVGIASFNIDKSDITPKGFTADISVVKTGATTATVTFTNVKGTAGGNKYFVVASNIAKDAAGNGTAVMNSPAFTLEEKVVEEKDTTAPIMTIGAANPKEVYAGGTVVYKVAVSDNVAIASFNIDKSDITPKGFTADISVVKTGATTATVTFTNVKGTVGGSKHFVIAAGVAKDAAGNRTMQMNSPAFSIKEKVEDKKDTVPPIMTIGKANPSSIYAGEKVIYKIAVSDDIGIVSFDIDKSDITPKGFTADISVVKTGNTTATVTFTNVKGTVGGSKHFVIAAGVAKDAAGNGTMKMNSPAFSIKEKAQEPVEKPVEKPTQKPVKDVTPNTGREEGTVAPVVAVVSTLALVGVAVAKKYTANNCK